MGPALSGASASSSWFRPHIWVIPCTKLGPASMGVDNRQDRGPGLDKRVSGPH